MIAAYAAGEVATAAAINLALVPVIDGIMSRTQGVIMVKAALDLLERPGGGPLRLPLAEADEAQRQQLRQDLKSGGFEL
jgi:4-hydroxy-tetrahydrodipicolinate synthase